MNRITAPAAAPAFDVAPSRAAARGGDVFARLMADAPRTAATRTPTSVVAEPAEREADRGAAFRAAMLGRAADRTEEPPVAAAPDAVPAPGDETDGRDVRDAEAPPRDGFGAAPTGRRHAAPEEDADSTDPTPGSAGAAATTRSDAPPADAPPADAAAAPPADVPPADAAAAAAAAAATSAPVGDRPSSAPAAPASGSGAVAAASPAVAAVGPAGADVSRQAPDRAVTDATAPAVVGAAAVSSAASLVGDRTAAAPRSSADAASGLVQAVGGAPDASTPIPVLQGVAAQPVQAAAPSGPVGATAATPIAPPLAEQLHGPLISLRTAPQGEHLLVVKVAPDNLGPVIVHATVSAGDLSVQLFGPTSEARDALGSMLGDLRRDLGAGSPGSTTTLSLGTGDAPQGDQRQASSTTAGWGAPDGRAAAGRAERGDAAADPARLASTAATGPAVRTSGASGLDVLA